MEPTFKQIWTRTGWLEFKHPMSFRNLPYRSRFYYQIRSVVRIAFWTSYVMIINQLLGWVDTW